jgi:hypothetical protein
MTDKNQIIDRDEVLYAFHRACARPTVEDISEWIRRYPQFSEDIRVHAAITRDWEARGEDSSEVPDVMLNRAYSRALSTLYSGDLANDTVDSSSSQSFQQLISACGKDVPALAREIGSDKGIARSVLADLVNGGMRPPIGRRFRESVMRALSISLETFNSALQNAINTPRMGFAKANVGPKINARSYEDVLKDSGMTPEQIRYWLDGD